MTPLQCAWATPSTIASNRSSRPAVSSREPRRYSSSVSPSASSIEYQSRPSVSPLSYTHTTFGWRSRLRRSTSRSNRRRLRGATPVERASSLSATLRRVDDWRAR